MESAGAGLADGLAVAKMSLSITVVTLLFPVAASEFIAALIIASIEVIGAVLLLLYLLVLCYACFL